MSQRRTPGPLEPRSPVTTRRSQQTSPTRPILPAQLWIILTPDQQHQVLQTLVLLCRALLAPALNSTEVTNESV
jgi:hypothetical protein